MQQLRSFDKHMPVVVGPSIRSVVISCRSGSFTALRAWVILDYIDVPFVYFSNFFSTLRRRPRADIGVRLTIECKYLYRYEFFLFLLPS